MARITSKEYRSVFLTANGSGPWSCHGCGESVIGIAEGEGLIHHLDGDRRNNAIDNLVAMHLRCHGQLHAFGIVRG